MKLHVPHGVRRGAFVLLVCILLGANATVRAADPLVDRSAYDALLAAYVKDEQIDYKGLARDRENLEAFVRSLGDISSETLRRASREERLAFWINAYNAITLLTVTRKYPASEGELEKLHREWVSASWQVADRKVSLNQIKHDILIKDLQEPLVHFALYTASAGGPALRPAAFEGEGIDKALEAATRRFLNEPDHNRVDTTSGVVYLSPLFRWFGEDFVTRYAPPERLEKRHGRPVGASLNLIALHLPPEAQRFVRSGEYEVKFLDYDWRLRNGRPASRAEPRPARPPVKPTPAKP